MNTALAIPEIVLSIAQHVDGPTLQAAAQVNRLWFRCAIPEVWRLGTLSRLSAVADYARRQFYASHIKFLYLVGSDGTRLQLDSHPLEFSSLQQVHLNYWREDMGSLADFLPYCLTPRVSKLVAWSVSCSDEEITILCKLFRHVKILELDNSFLDVSPATFAALIRSCPDLEQLSTGDMDENLHSGFLQRCASLSRLKRLTTAAEITEDDVAEVSQKVAKPFPSLRHLATHVVPNAIPALLAQVQHLTYLSLNIRSSDFPDLGGIRALAGLESLLLRLHGRTTLTKADLLHIAPLSKLKLLSVSSRYSDPEPTTLQDPLLLSDSELVEVLTSLPCLASLSLSGNYALTISCVFSLAARCPSLTFCALPHVIVDTPELEAAAAVPSQCSQLSHLDVGSFRKPFNVEASVAR